MRLEDSNGKILDPINEVDMNGVLAKVGSSLDFCILSIGDDFIQAAGSEGGLLIQYRDSSGQYESDDSSLSLDMVKKIFLSYLNKVGSWKTEVSFSNQDDGAGDDTRMNQDQDTRLNSGSEDISIESLKNMVVKAVRNEAGGGVSRMIKRFIRNIFR
jgi:hypothetical protein